MDLVKHIERALRSECGVPGNSHLLAAVSGGADSVALLLLLSELSPIYPLKISCVHVNHGIRGEDAAEDCRFVGALCRRLQVPCHTLTADVPRYAREHHMGEEEAGRKIRYAFFEETAREIHADFIVLAHHAEDQAETVLMHLLRGADIAGICGMQMRRDRLLRPLLQVSPGDLREYLRAKGQPWREDATNQDTRYKRNLVRKVLLPQMEEAFPGAGRALCHVGEAASRDERYFAEVLREPMESAVALYRGAAIPARFLKVPEAVAGRMLAALIRQAGIPSQSRERMQQMLQALRDGGRNRQQLEGGLFTLTPYAAAFTREVQGIDIPLGEGTDTPFGRFSFAEGSGDGIGAQRIPEGQIPGLRVTTLRKGDRMIPFGSTTPRSCDKLLENAGLPRAVRERIPVLRDADGEVLWLCGFRPSERLRSEGPGMCLFFSEGQKLFTLARHQGGQNG